MGVPWGILLSPSPGPIVVVSPFPLQIAVVPPSPGPIVVGSSFPFQIVVVPPFPGPNYAFGAHAFGDCVFDPYTPQDFPPLTQVWRRVRRFSVYGEIWLDVGIRALPSLQWRFHRRH